MILEAILFISCPVQPSHLPGSQAGKVKNIIKIIFYEWFRSRSNAIFSKYLSDDTEAFLPM